MSSTQLAFWQAYVHMIIITTLDRTRPTHLLYRAHHHVAVNPAHAIVVLGNVMQTLLHRSLFRCYIQTLGKLFNFETAVILRPSNN